MLEYDIKDIAATIAVAQLCKDKWSVEQFLNTFTEDTEEMVLNILVEYGIVEKTMTSKDEFNNGKWVGYSYSDSYIWA